MSFPRSLERHSFVRADPWDTDTLPRQRTRTGGCCKLESPFCCSSKWRLPCKLQRHVLRCPFHLLSIQQHKFPVCDVSVYASLQSQPFDTMMVVYTRIHELAKALSCVNYMLGLFFSQNHATVVHAMYADNVTMLSCSCSTYRRQLYVRPCCCTGMIYARGKA